MRKASCYMIAVLTILLGNSVYQILVYQDLIPKLVWSIDTLGLDYDGERELFTQCDKQRVQM